MGKDYYGFSYLIGANFTDPKMGRCELTNQSSYQGPLKHDLWFKFQHGVDCEVDFNRPNTTQARDSFALTRISPSDFALLYEMMGGSLYISLSSGCS